MNKDKQKFLHDELNRILYDAGYKNIAYSFYGKKLTIIASEE